MDSSTKFSPCIEDNCFNPTELVRSFSLRITLPKACRPFDCWGHKSALSGIGPFNAAPELLSSEKSRRATGEECNIFTLHIFLYLGLHLVVPCFPEKERDA
jgi:hypothetical protein